jgi:2-oxoglutarate ferredoxin oxidoreductase subunit alpha
MTVKITKSLLKPGGYFMSANEAAAEGAIAAGCRFYAGYPITPSSDIMERMSVRLQEVGGIFIQMEDELASIGAVVGASWAGAKAMTATSGPGFSLMQETIGYAVFTETPCVIIDVQRAGPSSGQVKVGSGDIMQAKWGSHGDYQIIALSPWSVQEMYDLTIRAFNLSERYRVPALVMSEETIGHLSENMTVPTQVEVWNRKKKKGAAPFGTEDEDGVPPMPAFGEGERLAVTGSTHDEYGLRKTDSPEAHGKLVDRINEKILKNRGMIVETEEYFTEDADIAIIAYGITARTSLYAVKQLRKQGIRVGLLRLKTLWPFPEESVEAIGKKVKKVIVPEMNRGQMSGEVKKACLRDVIHIGRTDGEIIRPEKILDVVKRC